MILVKNHTLIFENLTFRCALGKGGITSDKKEGDGCTPVGVFALRECWYRADRVAKPDTALSTRIITPEDGWCDDPQSPHYNRHILIPSPLAGEGQGGGSGRISMHSMPPHPSLPPQGGKGYECLWRDDRVYDIIVPLGYNDDPVVAGKGSAIFLHVATPEYAGTEGCVALAAEDLLNLLSRIEITTRIHIL